MHNGHRTQNVMDQYRYYMRLSFAFYILFEPSAGPINATAPIEKAVGSEVHNRYSTGEYMDCAASAASFRNLPINIETIT